MTSHGSLAQKSPPTMARLPRRASSTVGTRAESWDTAGHTLSNTPTSFSASHYNMMRVRYACLRLALRTNQNVEIVKFECISLL